jgi:hypothetical protein
MAYLALNDLIHRCLLRLRQVPGVGTQAYSEEHLTYLLEEVYDEVRVLRWWDHLMSWEERTLDGTTGKVTVPFTGARERFRDVQAVYFERTTSPLPVIQQHSNPYKYSGAIARAVEALPVSSFDESGTHLFRVWPLTATGTVYVRMRLDPFSNMFDINVNNVIPFDSTALINGVCMKYAIQDGTNPGAVVEFDRAYNERIIKLQQQHDSTPLALDERQDFRSQEWIEVWN